MEPVQTSSMQEVLRRRAGLGPSSAAAIPGGAQGANSPSMNNPIAAAGQTPGPGQGGAEGFGTQDAAKALKSQQPDEAFFITKALVDRQKKLTKELAMNTQAPTTPPQSPGPTTGNGGDIALAAMKTAAGM